LTVIFSVLEGVATRPPPWQLALNDPDVNLMVLPEVSSSVGVGPLSPKSVTARVPGSYVQVVEAMAGETPTASAAVAATPPMP